MMTPQAGLFTLMGQVFHNNYTDGIRELGFHMEKERFYLDVREGEKNVALSVGFGKAEYASIDFHGEPYLCAVEGRFASDEEWERGAGVDHLLPGRCDPEENQDFL